MTRIATVLDVVVGLLVVHTLVNAVLLRRPRADPTVDEPVSILLPMRDEAHRLAPMLEAVLAQRGLRAVEVLGYDDESRDGTADVVRRVGAARVRLVDTRALPPDALGKPHACARLADAASGSVLVFVDADVVLAPVAVAAAVDLLRSRRLAFLSPYPRQLAGSLPERVVQPLLQWSWLAFLPLRVAERSRRPSLAAANGQFLVVDTARYHAAGGHDAVRHEVVEDVALARALVRCGGHGTFADGSRIATCRMYDGGRAVVDGYAKSLWSAFGGSAGTGIVVALLVVLFVLPWALLAVTPWALPAALGGPLSRIVAAVRTRQRPLVDAIAHPLSVLVLAGLAVVSLVRHRRGTLSWKSRQLP